MQTALKQTVTVEAGGVVFVCSPELPAGAKAEVIILLETPVIEESTEQKQRAPFEERSTSRCVLCGKNREAVKKLILGVHGGVCVDCVELCQDIIEKARLESERVKTAQT